MPVVVYSVLRVLLFVVALVVLGLAGLRDWLLVLVAAVVALMLSYLTLRRPREAASRWLAARAEHRSRTGERFSRQIEDDAAVEDAALDAAGTDPGTGPGATDRATSEGAGTDVADHPETPTAR